MIKPWRRNRDSSLASIDPETVARDAVTDLRHRLYEDPEFRDSFGEAIRQAQDEQRAKSEAESRNNSDAYGDTGDALMSDKLHEARGDAFLEILNVLHDLASSPEASNELSVSARDECMARIREVLGTLANETYFQGQMEAPIQLKDGAMGVIYEGLGTVVVWERVQEYGLALDQIAQYPND